MKKEEFSEKLESLLEFNHKSESIKYSHDLMVISSKLFFDYCDTGSGVRGNIPYREIIDVALVDDHIKGIYLYLNQLSGELYIPASGFDIKTGATIHSVELYQSFKRAWIVQELKENQVMVVFATCKKEAVYMALSLFEFDVYDILENRVPYTIDTLPALDKLGVVLSDKDYLDPANEEDWEVLKQYGFSYDDEDHIQYSFRDQPEKRETP